MHNFRYMSSHKVKGVIELNFIDTDQMCSDYKHFDWKFTWLIKVAMSHFQRLDGY